jgi:hypothetical protein
MKSNSAYYGAGVALAASLFGVVFVAFVLGWAFAKDDIANDCNNFNAMVAGGQVYDCRTKQVDK